MLFHKLSRGESKSKFGAGLIEMLSKGGGVDAVGNETEGESVQFIVPRHTTPTPTLTDQSVYLLTGGRGHSNFINATATRLIQQRGKID